MVRKLVAVLAALPILALSVDAFACGTNVDDVVIRDRVVRDRDRTNIRLDETLARAAELDREARMAEQRAVAHATRAQSLRNAAASLEENVQVAFGETRDAILERIDALLERAAFETGEARTERLRASELRTQATRLRQIANGNNNGNGWRNRRRPVSDVPVPASVDI